MEIREWIRASLPVLDSSMAYRALGRPDDTPVLFLHGNPTSSHIWRDIMPEVAPGRWCVAPDLIGFGASGKPDIAYNFQDQARYLDAFIERMGLERFYLVAQDWGSALAFHFAARHPQRVLGLAFMEFMRPMSSWEDFHPQAQVRELFRQFRTPGEGEALILEQNVFIEKVLPNSVIRQLNEEEMAGYRAPFPTPESRRPILALPRQLPIAGEPADVFELIAANDRALRASTYPKLLFQSAPGVLTPPAVAQAYAAALHNCRLVDLGAGRHYVQEDHAQRIGQEIADWINSQA
ncbi:haloalkane dehalogenase [Massilia sp. BJB1822]|uniref:haloalkane dehalogenase n=1 Tax=Massilia sp. BJB1822 TaxID=2744470 RepID=UPI001592D5CF|nr:haloalkane dehalogenase [Massilia sp. BJB1822]NVD98528.1 haloalkane dehalogenase [Massilia sp. BJB1822]